jgi:alkaline phosphatase D
MPISGIQVLPEFRWQGENWARFPRARARLLNVLMNSGARGLLLASGDVHFAEISKGICRPVAKRGKGGEEARGRVSAARELWEVTSSGMTHSWQTYAQISQVIFFLEIFFLVVGCHGLWNGSFTGNVF